jgi:flagellar basal-body rod protein FlgC
MISATRTALTGMNAASMAVEASASNLANIRTAGRTADAKIEPGPVTPTRETAPPATGYRPVRVHQESVESGGVRARFEHVDPPQEVAYEPTNPMADEKGMVALPRVSVENEVISMAQATRAYEANLRVIATEDKMAGSLIDTIR